MVRFNATIRKFEKKGEKTGWTYITIPKTISHRINPDAKVSYRVRGKLDSHPVKAMALLPMGEGDFILPLKADLRKVLGKQHGDKLTAEMELDSKPIVLSPDLIKCLKAEPPALAYFKSLPGSHQRYFSKWIEDAKTIQTKSKRITMAVIALASKHGFPEMMREHKRENRDLTGE